MREGKGEVKALAFASFFFVLYRLIFFVYHAIQPFPNRIA